jgi:hypothetical protein
VPVSVLWRFGACAALFLTLPVRTRACLHLDHTHPGRACRRYQQCDCDAGFHGGNCALRLCPLGANPSQVCAEKSSLDVQEVDLSSLDASSSFVLEFTSALGATFATHPLRQTATAAHVQRALERLPNSLLPSVGVSRTADALQVTFSHPSTLGAQHLLRCNPSELVSACGSGTHPRFEAGTNATCRVTRVGEPETDRSKGYYEVSTCSGNGLCDGATGSCLCFDGFYGLACDVYAQVA